MGSGRIHYPKISSSHFVSVVAVFQSENTYLTLRIYIDEVIPMFK